MKIVVEEENMEMRGRSSEKESSAVAKALTQKGCAR